MQIGVTEFKRRLKELKFANEPIHLTKRGKYVGVFVPETAKAAALAAERQFRDSMEQRGFTDKVMSQIMAEAKWARS